MDNHGKCSKGELRTLLAMANGARLVANDLARKAYVVRPDGRELPGFRFRTYAALRKAGLITVKSANGPRAVYQINPAL